MPWESRRDDGLEREPLDASIQRQHVRLGMFFLVGACAGIAIDLLISSLISKTSFYNLMAMVAVAAGAGLVALIVIVTLRWLWRHRGEAFFAGLRNGVLALTQKPSERDWPSHFAHITNDHGRVVWKALLTFVAFWAGISLLTPIVTGLFSLANYLSSQAQVEVTASQNAIVAADQKFALEQSVAEQRYQQLATILMNSRSTPDEQIFALQELPEAMLLSVTRAKLDSDEPNGVGEVKSHPNLKRLRAILVQFMRRDRVNEWLEFRNIAYRPEIMLSPEAVDALAILGPVSTELLHCLHRMGPVNDQQQSLWSWDEETEPPPLLRPRLDDTESERLDTTAPSDNEPILDLRFFSSNELQNLCAPAALWALQWKLEFHDSANLHGAQLQCANLSRVIWKDKALRLTKANLAGAEMPNTDLTRCDFSNACLRRANLTGAVLSGVIWSNTNLQFARLDSAELTGATLTSVQLQGAKLLQAKLQGAHLINAQLQGVDLSRAQLQAANLSNAAMQGATLVKANLEGAVLAGTAFFAISEWVPSVGFSASRHVSKTAGVAIPGCFVSLYHSSSTEALFIRSNETPAKTAERINTAIADDAKTRKDYRYRPQVLVEGIDERGHLGIEISTTEPSWWSERKNWIVKLGPVALENLPFPTEAKDILEKALGPNALRTGTSDPVLIQKQSDGSIVRAQFARQGSDGAWVDEASREYLLNALKRNLGKDPKVNSAVSDMTAELSEAVIFPAAPAWNQGLKTREAWSLEKELESDQPLVRPKESM